MENIHQDTEILIKVLEHFLIQLLSLSLLSRILRGFKQVDRQLVPFLTVRLVTSFKKREFVPNKRDLSADNCMIFSPLKGPG